MSVAVYVSNDSDILNLVDWAIEFARASHVPLQIVLPSKTKSKISWGEVGIPGEDAGSRHKAIFKALDEQDSAEIVLKAKIADGEECSNHDRTVVSVFEVHAPDPETAFTEKLPQLDVDLLVIPIFVPVRNGKVDVRGVNETLFDAVHCQVVCIGGSHEPQAVLNSSQKTRKLLLACENEQDTDDDLALTKTAQLARSMNADVTLLYVRPPDDVVARQVADRHLKSLAQSFSSSQIVPEKAAALADNFVEGINQLDLRKFDLILAGTRRKKTIRRLVDNLNRETDGGQVSLAILKKGTPLADRLWEKFKLAVRGFVPQIDREHRVNLVDRLNSSSKFNFDFVALISLSTLIAALGLVRNSGAVVIGAMLVAPLMTPIVAIGLALVQGNERLLKEGVKSVILGFAVAVLIGFVVGACTASEFSISQQMYAREQPNLLDLIVALASGVAAAYAMGRPHLISALPGVAIAAALVPPIATAGLSFPMGDLTLAGGAALLFFTNVIAIVLGTAITFWSVGISTYVGTNSEQQRVQAWPRYWFIGFVVISCLLAVEMTYFSDRQADPPAERNIGNTKAFVSDQDG